jgi:hypothetical protein
MKQSTRNYITYIPWLLTSLVSIIAIYVWGHSLRWNIHAVTAYRFFPLLGLLGFSIMWSHYIIGFLKRTLWQDRKFSTYFRYTGYAVLLAILLHPGILIYTRFRDGYGLPPGSETSYVAPGMGWIVMLGSISLLAFLAFEFHRWYGQKTWWKYVIAAGDVAMIAIFYHGLRLGTQLQTGWYRGVWLVYGASLILAIGYKYIQPFLAESDE